MKILFVCLGNICRSPAGENILRHMLKQQKLDHKASCDSAGTLDYHTGKSPDSRMTSTLESRGLKVTGSARQIQDSDLSELDLILTMDKDNYSNVMRLASAREHSKKIKPFIDFCCEYTDTEVPDPYYGGQEGFEHVANMLENGCSNIISKLLS